MTSSFRPALVIVDLQEDFCPPNGSLAVKGGRDTIPIINDLLLLSFVSKIATKVHHLPGHVIFASNHDGKDAFTSVITVANPNNPEDTYETQLWPVHCVIGTPGNELVEELDISRVDDIVYKGMDPRVEMFSAIASPFRNPRVETGMSDLERLFRAQAVTHVFVVGLAGDYCVRSTAIDCAVECGWVTFVVEDGVRSVDPGKGWDEARKKMEEAGVRVIGLQDEVLQLVRSLG